ncbi:MAG: hypothetical protein DME76_09625 [Verrucomicrobia bacterium]|nr:MAG: hypothetical protein DME76_09625 [Verrucomicrobiota bacterium]
MKLKLYLDTSVFSAYLDDRAPDRRAQTVEFWERLTVFDACTSELAREELENTPTADRRKRLLRMLDRLTVHPITLEMRELSERYVQAGVFTRNFKGDFHEVF